MNSCIGALGFGEPVLNDIEQAIRDCSILRLQTLLSENRPSKSLINCRNLLHQAAWLGHTGCVQLLLEYGIEPDKPHTTNGCTALHLAHFCTIEDRDCFKTIHILVEAGANINSPGGRRCGKVPLRHAIQHQRKDSVEALLAEGSQIDVSSMLLAMDIGNFSILEMLILHGGNCGPKLESNKFWGEVLQKFIYLPPKSQEAFRAMLRLIIRATVTSPVKSKEDLQISTSENQDGVASGCISSASAESSKADYEVRRLLKNPDHKQLAVSLLDGLLRNGFKLTRSLAVLAVRNGFDRTSLKFYLTCPPSLRDSCVCVIRHHLAIREGNIYSGLKQVELPPALNNLILLSDLF